MTIHNFHTPITILLHYKQTQNYLYINSGNFISSTQEQMPMHKLLESQANTQQRNQSSEICGYF